MSKVLLYSGGTDSWLIDKIWKPDVRLYVNVCGKYSNAEISRLPSDVVVVNMPFLGTLEQANSIIPLRNLYFLMIASNFGTELCLGATKSDRGGKDKRPMFFRATQFIMNYCLRGNSYGSHDKIRIVSKFYNKTKPELIKMYLKNGGNIRSFIDDTFSCYSPKSGKECLECKPCYRKFLMGYYFGYPYSTEQKKHMVYYLIHNVISNNDGGTYFTRRQGEGKVDMIAVTQLFKEFELDWRKFV